jgi:pimeloyl-ACP methyl ester carboxylesterase
MATDIVTLHYSEAGQGTPVVLLHGFPLSGAIWHAQQKRLSEHCRVIMPDLRGHGRSPAPSDVASEPSCLLCLPVKWFRCDRPGSVEIGDQCPTTVS